MSKNKLYTITSDTLSFYIYVNKTLYFYDAMAAEEHVENYQIIKLSAYNRMEKFDPIKFLEQLTNTVDYYPRYYNYYHKEITLFEAPKRVRDFILEQLNRVETEKENENSSSI